MSDNFLNLFCLVDGEPTSNAFPLSIPSAQTVGQLKKLIKSEKTHAFSDIDADKLTLWRVSIQDNDEEDDLPILLDSVPDKKKLKATHELSDIFEEKPPKKTIHVIIQRPSLIQPDLGIIVKPEKKVAFSWSTIVNEATLDDFRSNIFPLYPQYTHDEYLEIFVYNGQPKPEPLRNNEDLRKLLKIAKATSKTKLTISLETPTKKFSSWTFKDVCDEYDLAPGSTDPSLEDLPPFTGIEAVPLVSDDENKILTRLIDEVRLRVDVLKLLGANESTKSMVVASFLLAATKLFKDDLYLAAQRDLSGRRGHGPMDYSVHSRKSYEYTLGVTEVKKEDFKQGVAQNIVQLESALTAKKRKRNSSDIDGEEDQPMKTRSYGIVTDASLWLLIECTLHEDETVSYRMKEIERTINFAGDWQDDAKFVFERLVWLWSRMRDEIPARDSYSRKLSTSPSNKRANFTNEAQNK
ncbi:hypothetical protein BGX28_009963 [Mortierella sp. GBA30]|nr:hypothetical protein BGX28_009963 [Mortierella sp. GBA30]